MSKFMFVHLRTWTYRPSNQSSLRAAAGGLEDDVFFLLVHGYWYSTRESNQCIFDPKIQVQTLVRFAAPGTRRLEKNLILSWLHSLSVCAVFRSQLPYCFGRNRGACKKRTQHQVFPTKPTLSSIEQVPEVVCSRLFQRENNKSRLTSNTKTWNESGVCMVDLICSVWSFQAMRN